MNASKYKSIIIVYNAQTKYMVSPTPVISIKGDLVPLFFSWGVLQVSGGQTWCKNSQG